MSENPFVGLVVGALCVVFGILACLFPLQVTRVAYMWPKFILPRILGNNIPAKAREGIELLDADPKMYRAKYRYQLTLMRLTGMIAIFIGVIGILGMLSIIY